MSIDPKTQRDIDFTRSVLGTLNEPERAAQMARVMIERYSARSGSQDSVNAYRRILIDAANDETVLDIQIEQFETLFAGYLAVGDKIAGAKLLLEMDRQIGRIPPHVSLEAVSKCIELFKDNKNTDISNIVNSAFISRNGYTCEDYGQFVSNYTEYAEWLAQANLPEIEIVSSIISIKKNIERHVWLPIATKFLATKIDDLSTKEVARLQLGVIHELLVRREFDDAIDMGFELLKQRDSEVAHRAEALLLLGLCFKELAEYRIARMFLREAKDLLVPEPGHPGLKIASVALDQIADILAAIGEV